MAVIDVAFDRVTKRYRIPPEPDSAPQGMLDRLKRKYLSPPNYFTAVRDLSFEVPRGQALGIIGHNGAGKSTILKLLSGITAPSEGLITVRGNVAALLEVGSGFHPELTGRENIFLSGSILGMSRKEIHRKLDRIVDFAEIRQFIDVPVKRYSSGMYVRLGFSIAAHLEPDVLLLDEVLAVGDATFQQKSKQRILELKEAATTIVFISHDLHAVQQVCDRVLVIRKGALIYDGDPHAAVVAYEKSGSAHIAPAKTVDARKSVSILSMDLLDPGGGPVRGISTGSPLRVRVRYRVHVPVSNVRLMAVFHTPDWGMKCTFTTAVRGDQLDLSPGECTVEFVCDELALQPGLYMLDPVVEQAGLVEPVDWIPDCTVVQVAEGAVQADGAFYHSHRWSFVDEEGTESEACASRSSSPADAGRTA